MNYFILWLLLYYFECYHSTIQPFSSSVDFYWLRLNWVIQARQFPFNNKIILTQTHHSNLNQVIFSAIEEKQSHLKSKLKSIHDNCITPLQYCNGPFSNRKNGSIVHAIHISQSITQRLSSVQFNFHSGLSLRLRYRKVTVHPSHHPHPHRLESFLLFI